MYTCSYNQGGDNKPIINQSLIQLKGDWMSAYMPVVCQLVSISNVNWDAVDSGANYPSHIKS